MTKLVSRDPIQRFKEGRKIIKADGGTRFEHAAKGFGSTVQTNKNGNRYYTAGNHNYFENGEIWDNRTGKKTGTVNAYAKEYSSTQPKDQNKNRVGMNTARRHNYKQGEVEYRTNKEGKQIARMKSGPDTNWYYVSEGSTGYDQFGNRNVLKNGQWVSMNSQSKDKGNVVNGTNTGNTATPVAKPTPTSFMGQGIQQGWRGTVGKTPELTDQQKLQLINTGKFTDNDFTNAGALQTALNNYFGGTVGSISVDNKWGEQSQKALNAALAATKNPGTYMNLSQSLDLPNLDGTKTRTNIHGRYNITGLLSNKMTNPENISTINLSNASPAITPQVSNVNLNRAQTRDLMRAHNLNPYDYSGAQRKALRNFYSTGNYDSNLLSGIISKDYKWLKKGGIISRNPVKQFKVSFRKEAL